MRRWRSDLKEADVTPEALWLRRREFLLLGAAGAIGAAFPAAAGEPAGEALSIARRVDHAGGEDPTKWDAVTTYNNFYEFGTEKHEPAQNAHTLRPRPWTVAVDGEVARPRTFDVDALLRAFPLEERIYRLRCVEAWSMVVPWVGFPLAALAKQVEPTSRAKFVVFETLHDPEQMPGQRRRVLPWPYREALRVDEAVHPLTLLAVGLYGRVLPNQNGAPIRLVVPWKYGFKSAKSLVRIRFVEKQPKTTWNEAQPREYGFYANVNPDVSHPRWSQARERRIGKLLRQRTLPFNGYTAEVGGLYAGMDLREHY